MAARWSNSSSCSSSLKRVKAWSRAFAATAMDRCLSALNSAAVFAAFSVRARDFDVASPRLLSISLRDVPGSADIAGTDQMPTKIMLTAMATVYLC